MKHPLSPLTLRLMLGLMLAGCLLSGCNRASSDGGESASAETPAPESSEIPEAPSPAEEEALELPTTVTQFQDVSADPNDLSVHVDLSGVTNLIDPLLESLTFSTRTIFPEDWQQKASDLLERCKDPGLGVRQLHEGGITGEGVSVAIIDQPMYQNHPEFEGKILEYRDFDTDSSFSMHGPAVTSLLAGETIGTAPGAKVYYGAVPSWQGDAQYFTDALQWMIQLNETLPEEEKIRVVSVSAAPSDGQMFTNEESWLPMVERAEENGMVVLDCTSEHGVISPCYYSIEDPDDLTLVKVGFKDTGEGRMIPSDDLFVPSSSRTVAEQYLQNEPSYTYNGNGGLSWSIPYAAGVLAMGFQLRPEVTGEDMLACLMDTAYVREDGFRIINPPAFIEALQQME